MKRLLRAQAVDWPAGRRKSATCSNPGHPDRSCSPLRKALPLPNAAIYTLYSSAGAGAGAGVAGGCVEAPCSQSRCRGDSCDAALRPLLPVSPCQPRRRGGAARAAGRAAARPQGVAGGQWIAQCAGGPRRPKLCVSAGKLSEAARARQKRQRKRTQREAQQEARPPRWCAGGARPCVVGWGGCVRVRSRARSKKTPIETVRATPGWGATHKRTQHGPHG